MHSKWSVLPLGEVVENVYDGPHATPKKIDSGPVFLGVSNLSFGRLDLSDTNHLSEEDFIKWTRRITPHPDDLVFSYETRIGQAALIPEGLKCCLGRRMGLLRPDLTKVDPRFLLYAYIGPEFQQTLAARTIHGSTVPRIRLTEMSTFPIRIPPLQEQRAIAHILGALNDKIELNRQMNRTLEDLAQATFKSWFVDFDPVVAKADGRPPFGMSAGIAALFPDRFVGSELGLVPEGWTTQRTEDILKLSYGKSLPKKNRIDGPVPVYGSGGVNGTHNESLVTGPGIIVGRKGTVGSLYWEDNDFFPIDTVFYVEPEEGYSLEFLFYALQTLGLDGMNTDAAVPGLNRNNVYRLEIPKYPVEVVAKFTQIARSIRRNIKNCNSQNATLVNLRDTLLPKLLSGELRVGQAEKVVEEVV